MRCSIMKTLTIQTQNFRHELENTLNLRCTNASGLYYAACTIFSDPDPDPDSDQKQNQSQNQNYEKSCKSNVETLTCLLERIVILKHPVYSYSSKLVNMAHGMGHTEMHLTNLAELNHFIEENNLLHLEGYTTFRMADYRHKLDMMMYCAIKKMKLTDVLL